jgi:hypothetical protein
MGCILANGGKLVSALFLCFSNRAWQQGIDIYGTILCQESRGCSEAEKQKLIFCQEVMPLVSVAHKNIPVPKRMMHTKRLVVRSARKAQPAARGFATKDTKTVPID